MMLATQLLATSSLCFLAAVSTILLGSAGYTVQGFLPVRQHHHHSPVAASGVLPFSSTPSSPSSRIDTTTTTATTTSLYGIRSFVGRFRKKKKIQINDKIEIGSMLPSTDVELITARYEEDGTTTATEPSTVVSLSEYLGDGTNVLVGMPGAFTDTCSKEHLPGYIKAAPTLQTLGVDKIAVMTTNDRFVNRAWAEEMGLLNGDQDKDDGDSSPPLGSVTLLADGDGDAARELGLAEDMGFGVGIRSKRFVLLTKDGKVSYLAENEGMDECTSTSAAALVKYLTPDEVPAVADEEIGAAGSGVLVAGVLLACLMGFSGDVGSTKSSTPPPPPAPARIQKVAPAKAIPQSAGGFSLLELYGK